MFCDPRCGLSWKMFQVHLRRCILLHLDGMSWKYQWDPSHLMYHLRLVFPYFLFWWSVHQKWGCLKFPTITVLLSISPFMSVNQTPFWFLKNLLSFIDFVLVFCKDWSTSKWNLELISIQDWNWLILLSNEILKVQSFQFIIPTAHGMFTL